jgi:hypothetical protein
LNRKIGFNWINDSIVYDDPTFDSLNPGLINKFYSVAIDNIVISGNFVDPNINVNRTASANKIDIKTVSDKKNNPTIVLRLYISKLCITQCYSSRVGHGQLPAFIAL